jgi:hypothetical protein
MKNPYFLDEQEWRYFLNIREVREAALGIKPSFAVSAGRLKPYLEFPDESPREPKLNRALAHVICGPRLEMSAAKAAVERLLVVHRYTECNVRCSVLADVWR